MGGNNNGSANNGGLTGNNGIGNNNGVGNNGGSLNNGPANNNGTANNSGSGLLAEPLLLPPMLLLAPLSWLEPLLLPLLFPTIPLLDGGRRGRCRGGPVGRRPEGCGRSDPQHLQLPADAGQRQGPRHRRHSHRRRKHVETFWSPLAEVWETCEIVNLPGSGQAWMYQDVYRLRFPGIALRLPRRWASGPAGHPRCPRR